MIVDDSIQSRLKQSGGPIVLDGGLGSELDRRGFDISSDLWSAQMLINHPETITEVHKAYLGAGAQCVTSASYQASIDGFANLGLSQGQSKELMIESVALARSAVDEFLLENPGCAYNPLVAASIGPYGAYLADGSEYRGYSNVDDRVLVEFHQQRLDWLDQAGADLLACETIPCIQEAKVLSQLLEQVKTNAWVSFSCQNERLLNDGSTIGEVVRLFESVPKVIAIGVNCTAPQYIESLIGEIKSAGWKREILVYPNSGEDYDAESNSWHGTETPIECAAAALTWHQAGASLIGGCCRMGPDHIRAMARVVGQQGNVQV